MHGIRTDTMAGPYHGAARTQIHTIPGPPGDGMLGQREGGHMVFGYLGTASNCT